jgi:hypothetical protein
MGLNFWQPSSIYHQNAARLSVAIEVFRVIVDVCASMLGFRRGLSVVGARPAYHISMGKSDIALVGMVLLST